jgi:hypothetical protein
MELFLVILDAKQGAREGRGFKTNSYSYCCRELDVLAIFDPGWLRE